MRKVFQALLKCQFVVSLLSQRGVPLHTASLHKQTEDRKKTFSLQKEFKVGHVYRFSCHCWQWREGDRDVVAWLELKGDIVIVCNHTTTAARAVETPGTMATLL